MTERDSMRSNSSVLHRAWPVVVKAIVLNVPFIVFLFYYRLTGENRYVTYRLPVIGDLPKSILFDVSLIAVLIGVWVAAQRYRWARLLYLVLLIPAGMFVLLFRVTDYYYSSATKVPLNSFVLYTNLSSANEGMNVVLHEPFCLFLGLAVALHYAACAWSRRYSAVITRVAERLSAPRNRRVGMLAFGAVLMLLVINAHALRAHERRGDAVLAMSGEYFFLNGLPRFFREEALKSYSVAAKPARLYLPPSDRVVAAPAPTSGRKPNIFLVTVESFNSLYTLPPAQLNPQLTAEVMPFFKSLASDGLMFTNVYTSSAYTFNGIIAVLCSQYTMAESVWGTDCLPQLLKRTGYETFAFVSIPQLRPYRYDNFQAMGFDRSHVFDAVRMRVGRKNVFFNAMTDKELFDYAARIADSTSRASTRPLFLHVSTDAMHVPGLVPHPGCTPYEFPPSLEVDKLTRRMLNAAHCTDYDLATYIAHLKASGLYDDALVIITADHAFNLSFWDRKETELAKIPLFVKFPRSDTTKREVLLNRLSAQVDIVPTIIDYLGLTTNRPMYGRSLLANANDPAREMPGISNSRLMSLASPSGAALHQRGKSDVADHRVQDELDAFYETVLYFDQNPKSFQSEVRTARGAARP